MHPANENRMRIAGVDNGRIYRIAPIAVWIACVVMFLARIGSLEYFSAAPLYQENYPKYFYTSEIAGEILSDQGAFWGYDPNFAAGLLHSPGGSTIAYGLPAILCAITGLPATIIIKAIIALFFLAFPWLIYLSARRFGLTTMQAAAVMALDAVMNYYSLRYRSIHASMGLFYSATPVVLYISAILFSSGNKREPRPYSTMGLVAAAGALLVYWHILQVGLLAMATLLHVVKNRKLYLTARNFPSLLMAVGIVLLLSWPWLRPFVQFQWEIIPFHDEIFDYANLEWHQIQAVILILVMLLHPLTVFSFVAGIASRPLSDRTKRGFNYLFTFALLSTVISIIFNLSRFGRSMTAMRFLDIVPACLFIVVARHWQVATMLRGKKRNIIGVAVVIFVVALQVLLTVVFDFAPKFRNRPSPEYSGLVQWIEKETDNSARIAFETTGKAGDQPFAFTPVSLLARSVDREWIALPSLESANILYNAFLYEGQMGPHDLPKISSRRMSELMDLYNIGWIVALSDTTKRVLKNNTGLFKLIQEDDSYAYFHVNRRHTFFLAGSGRISAHPNRITLSELKPDESGQIAISYHHFHCITANNDAKVLRLRNDLDAIGFIEVQTDKSEVDIICDRSRGFRSIPNDYVFRSLD